MNKDSFDEFYEINKKYWSDSKNTDKDNNTLVFVDCNYLLPVIETMLFTKRLQEENSSSITIGFYPKLSENMRKVYESYNIKSIVNLLDVHFSTFFKTISYIPKVLLCRRDIDLLRFRIDSMPVGEEIYDDILRKAGLLTLNKLTLKNKKFILKYIYFYYSFYRIAKKYRIKRFVYTDCDYDNSAFTKVCQKLNIQIYQIGRGQFYQHKETEYDRLISYAQITYDKFEKTVKTPNIQSFIESENKIHFAGAKDNYLDSVAFKGKRLYSKKELLQKYNLDDDKKIIIVASHAFCDAPHGANYDMIFKDYYDWFVKTIVMLSKINKYNVFVKEHPSSAYYNEKGSVDTILKEYNISNIYKVPDDLSTLCLYDFVDCFITCCGTIGIEAACFGIPAVTAAKGYYFGYGLDYNCSNLEEYEKTLNNLETLSKRPEIIDTAKVVMYLACQRYSDNISSILPKDRFLSSDQEPSDEEKIKIITSLMKEKSPKDEYYYNQLENCFVFDNNQYPKNLANEYHNN